MTFRCYFIYIFLHITLRLYFQLLTVALSTFRRPKTTRRGTSAAYPTISEQPYRNPVNPLIL